MTFALAYFNYDDLPKDIDLDMDYFEVTYNIVKTVIFIAMYILTVQEAIAFFQEHPKVRKGGIGVIGISLGSDIATYMAIMSPQVILQQS